MALIKCPECGKQVSSRAEVCIHCGYPLQKYAGGQNAYSGYQDDFGNYPQVQGGYGRYPNQQPSYSQQGNIRQNSAASYSAVRNIRASGTRPNGPYTQDEYTGNRNASGKNWRLRAVIGITVALLCAGVAILLLVLGNRKPPDTNTDALPTFPVSTDQATKPPTPTIPPAQNQNQNQNQYPNQEKFTQPPAPTEPAGTNQEGFTHPPAPTQPTNNNNTQEIPLFNYTDNG